jgi:hypothetical protein
MSAQAQAPLAPSAANDLNMNQPSLDGGGFATAAGASTHQRPLSASYFSYPPQDMPVEDQTLSNTGQRTHYVVVCADRQSPDAESPAQV